MPDQKIVEYIKNQLILGVAREIIRNNLVQKGWPSENIDLAFLSLNQNVAPELQTPSPVNNLPVNNIQACYHPVGVPAQVAPRISGGAQAVIGILCGLTSLLLYPPILGAIGIILGVFAIRKGEKTFGTVAIIISSFCMVIGIGLLLYLFLLEKGLIDNSYFTGSILGSLY